MTQIDVKKVSAKSDLMSFIRFPWEIYHGDPNWVPPMMMDMKTLLNREKNPFFRHSKADYFLAYKEGKIVGRIAAILNNNHNSFHEENVGFFGFFEAIQDQEVTNALLQQVEAWARSHQLDLVRGPMNFSTNDTCGMLVDGYDLPPMIMMTYNPTYYNDLLEQAGYEKAQDLLAYRQFTAQGFNPRLRRIAQSAREIPGLKVRHLNMKKFWDEVRLIQKIYNEAWSKNWGFVPMTDQEIHHLAKELKPVVDARYVYLAEIDGEPAAFALSLPDYNQALIKINGRLLPFGILKLLHYSRKIDALRVMILGVVSRFQSSGLGALLYEMTYDNAAKHGVKYGEFSWILESNKPMNSAAKIMGGEVYKRYRVYEKQL